MIVVTRLRAPEGQDPTAYADLRAGLDHALEVLSGKPGFVGGEVGRNIDDPGLWVLSTRWEGVGAYRRAISSWEGKLYVQPVMVHAVDEPSAYEVLRPGEPANEPVPRRNW